MGGGGARERGATRMARVVREQQLQQRSAANGVCELVAERLRQYEEDEGEEREEATDKELQTRLWGDIVDGAREEEAMKQHGGLNIPIIPLGRSRR